MASTRTADAANLGYLGAAIAVVAWGSASVLAKYLEMGALAIATYRFTLYGLAMVLIFGTRGTPIGWRVLRHSFWGGLALGLDVALFFSAVKLTNVVNATVIGALQPIVVTLVAVLFFGETVARRNLGWAAVAMAGAIGVVVASSGTPQWSLRGDLLSAAAVLAWSGYFVASKASKGRLTPTEFTAGTALWTGLLNFGFALVVGEDLSWPAVGDWVWLIVMTVGSGVLGHSLMNWSLVRIPLWVGSTLTLLIPVTASVLATIVLGEPLTAAQVAAMAVVLVALFLIVRSQATTKPPEALVPVDPSPRSSSAG